MVLEVVEMEEEVILIYLLTLIVSIVGFFLTKSKFKSIKVAVVSWLTIFVVLVICESIFITNALNGYYSKHPYP